MEGGIEGALPDLEHVAGDLLKTLCDGVCRTGPSATISENEEIEGAPGTSDLTDAMRYLWLLHICQVNV